MKKQRKIVFWAASLLLTGALAAGGTLAYLTDKDSVTNQFVVGKVDIEGNEPSYAPDPDGKTNHIVPTQVIPKDPRIKNKGKNDSYVYMDVSIPIAKVIVADTSGNRLNGGAAVDTELFSMNQLSRLDDSGIVFIGAEVKGADVQEKTEQFDGIYISLQ